MTQENKIFSIIRPNSKKNPVKRRGESAERHRLNNKLFYNATSIVYLSCIYLKLCHDNEYKKKDKDQDFLDRFRPLMTVFRKKYKKLYKKNDSIDKSSAEYLSLIDNLEKGLKTYYKKSSMIQDQTQNKSDNQNTAKKNNSAKMSFIYQECIKLNFFYPHTYPNGFLDKNFIAKFESMFDTLRNNRQHTYTDNKEPLPTKKVKQS